MAHTVACDVTRQQGRKQGAEEALPENRMMFETLYERAPDAMIVVDEIGTIERVNVQAEILFGFSRRRMLGQSIEMLIPDRLRDRHSAQRSNDMKSPKLRPMGKTLPLMAQRSDGSRFPVDIMLSPIEIERRPVVLAVVRDITERKHAEAHLQILMRELNHRAKNILSVVQAMAQQTRANSYEEFISKFSKRILSLSASHDLLVRNVWKDVLLDELVRSQLAHFGDLLGSRIGICGPELRIIAAAAQAIGLAIHELATNAGKYGALSAEAGHVEIRWWVDSDDFRMSWVERGGPPVRPPDRLGFGTTVIVPLVKRTVNGDVQLDYAPPGLRWHLICPATNALESIASSAVPEAAAMESESIVIGSGFS